MNLALKIVAFGGTALLAFLGVLVTLRPVEPKSSAQKKWLFVFAIGGVISFVAALWLSERQDTEMETKLTGGDNYVYVRADEGDLQGRKDPVRTWICSTGHMFDVKIHPFPFGAVADDHAYVSIPGAYDLYLGSGCRWLGIPLHPGKFSFELEARNGLLIQTFEITKTAEGPFTEACEIKRNGEPLATAGCPPF